jgi:hypothetical protein
MTTVMNRNPETIVDERGLGVPMEDTMLTMAERGRETEIELRGTDVVERWLTHELSRVELSRRELEDYALSLGEHLVHITREGWATHIAGFEDRAAGLFIAVEATIQQLDRIYGAREQAEAEGTATLAMTAFDYVNALGLRSYDEVIADHGEWLEHLNSESPDVVEQSPLLQFFTEDFQALQDEVHPQLKNKVAGQSAMTATDAPNPTEGVEV